jgi:hypothetical protein
MSQEVHDADDMTTTLVLAVSLSSSMVDNVQESQQTIFQLSRRRGGDEVDVKQGISWEVVKPKIMMPRKVSKMDYGYETFVT